MGGRRGQLITLPDRQHNVKLINEAILSGARQHKACEVIGLSVRTLQRWQADGGVVEDKRPRAIRAAPANKENDCERWEPKKEKDVALKASVLMGLPY